MKIKTICESTKWAGDFDSRVNEAMDEGWQLVRREVIPGSPNDSNKLYAELVLPDPPADPDPEQKAFDPFQTLSQLKEFCEAQESCYTCPIQDWCNQLLAGGDPTDWELPEQAEVVPF